VLDLKNFYRLKIDQEGYPMNDDGLRLDDESFLKEIFQNLKRHPEGDKFPLLSVSQGNNIYLESFDEPLVAQEVTLEKNTSIWSFLGGLTHKVELEELKTDEWHRLHAFVGEGRIPAVMNHKAQAAFLLSLKDPENLDLQPYRSSTKKLNWDELYKENDTPWEMTSVNPVFEKEAKSFIEKSGKTLLIPGAGIAHEAAYFEKNNKIVSSLDISPLAKEKFHKSYPASKTQYLVGDFFEEELFKSSFEAIIENYFFVALDPELRPKVLKRIHKLLKPQGFYAGVFFMRASEQGPPYGLSEWELQRHIEGLFKIIEWKRSPHSHPRRLGMELWCVLEKA
jgi:SAM-dependent methyltransferase